MLWVKGYCEWEKAVNNNRNKLAGLQFCILKKKYEVIAFTAINIEVRPSPHPAPIDHGARGAILPTIYHIYTAGVRTTRDLTPYDSIIVTSSYLIFSTILLPNKL
jgi:hypothetical protein